MKLILFIILLCWLSGALAELPSHWIDPTDMKDPQRGRRSSFRQTTDDIGTNNYKNYSDLSNNCNNISNSKIQEDFQHIFKSYKRFVNSLIKKLQVNFENDNLYVLKLNIELDEEQRNVLEIFGKSNDFNSNNLRDIDNLLAEILLKSSQTKYMETVSNFTFMFLSFITSTQTLILLYVCFLSYITYRLIYIRFSITWALAVLLLISFIMAIGWTWYNLYEEEQIRLMAERMRYPIPPKCNPQAMSWWERLTSNRNVDCHKYAHAHYKSAFSSITPQMVFAEIFGQGFNHLMSHCIQSIANFFSIMLDRIPWPLNWIALPFLVLFVLVALNQLLVLVFGVNFRLNLFHLVTYEFGSRRHTAEPIRNRRRRVYLEDVSEESSIEYRRNNEHAKSHRTIKDKESSEADKILIKNKHKSKNTISKEDNYKQESSLILESNSSSTSSWEDIEDTDVAIKVTENSKQTICVCEKKELIGDGTCYIKPDNCDTNIKHAGGGDVPI